MRFLRCLLSSWDSVQILHAAMRGPMAQFLAGNLCSSAVSALTKVTKMKLWETAQCQTEVEKPHWEWFAIVKLNHQREVSKETRCARVQTWSWNCGKLRNVKQKLRNLIGSDSPLWNWITKERSAKKPGGEEIWTTGQQSGRKKRKNKKPCPCSKGNEKKNNTRYSKQREETVVEEKKKRQQRK